jgi:OOP family OmpA-OmpF porin
MLIFKIIFFVFFITLCGSLSNINAQNLIPNSSFEEANPDSAIALDFKNNFTCKVWNSPTKGTPDYFNSNRTGDFGCPKNRYGFLMAHSGVAYCGFVTKYNSNSFEYLQVKLNSKLIKDSIYCISFYVSVPQYAAFSTNEVNCFFTNEKNELNLNHEIINSSSYIKLLTKENYIKPSIWNQVINYYTAKGGEEYIVIGMLNMKYNNFKINTASSSNVQKGIYMFIDDVSLRAISDSTDCKLEEISISYKEAIDKPLILKNLNFETNKAVLKNTANPELVELANYLKQNPKYKLEITGHTDNIGKEVNNLALSYARAKSIAEFLIAEKVPKNRIKYNGMGSKYPIKPNDSEDNRLINRRVEIRISK